MGTKYVAIGKTSSGKTVWGKTTPKSKSSSSGNGGSKTYKYKSGDRPPRESEFKSHAEYSKASYAYSKSKRASTISRAKSGAALSKSELRGAGITGTAEEGYKYYDSATKKYVTTPSRDVILQQKAQAEQKRITELKSTTSEKEKQIMVLEYGLQQGMFSKKAAEKARAQQQELMKGLPEKEPVETAFVVGGKTFVGTYGLKRVYVKPEEKEAPKISIKGYLDYTSKVKKEDEEKPIVSDFKRHKELEETIDIITPSPTGYTSIKKSILTEDKPANMWESAITSFVDKPTLKGAIPALMGAYGFKNIPEIKKEFETKEIEAMIWVWLVFMVLVLL